MKYKNNYQSVHHTAKQLKLLILDVDGVLTDGRLFFDHQGAEYKAFHTQDGQGIKLLQQTGVAVAVISGRKSSAVALRMHDLGIQQIHQGQAHKVNAFETILSTLNIMPDQAVHVGDDFPDLPLMQRAGLAIAVEDAHFAVKEYADCTTENQGGLGAVREVCDFIMQAQGNFEPILQHYLNDTV
jgi:3-deoxy-D-manno-octulosonate 8-phosphate phosphatase (KDO 8-P phosphatase)